MSNRKKLMALFCGLLMVVAFTGAARAANEIGTNVLEGKEYVCFLVAPQLQVVNATIEFAVGRGFIISGLGGYGLYFGTATDQFAAAYWAVNSNFAGLTGDVVILLIGSAIPQLPYIFGTGYILVDYSIGHPLVFAGFQTGV